MLPNSRLNGLPSKVNYGSLKNSADPLTDDSYSLNLLNVNYTVKEYVSAWWKACFRKRRTKTILNGITTQFCSGEISAVLGNSGSGKTSLLDILSCRPEGKVSGTISLNNYVCTKDLMKQTSAYVLQADRLLHTLTVRETLTYAAFLRLPANTKQEQRDEKVKHVIQSMGLKPVADSKVGGNIVRGISGGERRRVTIGIQLLQDPSILLLDEPTTGLDSFTARHLISNLADVAHKGKMVILTIHQPRSDIFKLFDKITILSSGCITYSGKASEIANYFGGIGFPCPTYANPLDIYVDISSIDRRTRDREQKTSERVEGIIDNFHTSQLQTSLRTKVTTSMGNVQMRELKLYKPRSPNAFRILFKLIGRMMVHLGRDRDIYIGRLFLQLVFTPIICFFFGRIGLSQGSIQDRIGLIYQGVFTPGFISIANAILFFPPLRDLYYRETADGLYSIVTFMFAYAIHIFPFHVVASFLFTIVVYWVTGLYPEWDRYATLYAIVVAHTFIYDLLAAGMMGIIFNPIVAQNMISLIFSVSILVSSGILKRIENMLEILQWLAWTGLPKYTTEIIVVNEFKDLIFDCPTNSSVPCQFLNGTSFLKHYFPGAIDHTVRNVSVLGGFVVLSLIVAMSTFTLRGTRNLR